MATIESIIALRDKMTSTLTNVSNAAAKTAESLSLLEKNTVDELVSKAGVQTLDRIPGSAANVADSLSKINSQTVNELVAQSGISSVNAAANAAAAVAENMAQLESASVGKLVATDALENANKSANAITAAAEGMTQLENNVIDTLVTQRGIETAVNAANAAAMAAENVMKLDKAAASELIGVEDVSRMELMARQAVLMEARWISQQNMVAKLTEQFNQVVNQLGFSSDEAKKLDEALLSAQMQENRLAINAVKAAEEQVRMAQSAALVAENMSKAQEVAAANLIAPGDVNRIELMLRQAQLMEERWSKQQQLVARLGAEYESVIKIYGRGSSEAEKATDALMRAEQLENRLAINATKAADEQARMAQAAALAAEKMNNMHKAATANLISPGDVNRAELIAKQTELMENRWTRQQKLVAKLAAEYESVVKVFGRGSDEAEKLAEALTRAQYQENRLALGAVKAADEQSRFAQSASQSHMKLLNMCAAVNLIKLGIQKIGEAFTVADEYRDINARLAMANDGLMSQQQLQAGVYQAARNTRTAYADIADTINRIQWNAPDLFVDTSSAVKYAELATKAMKVGSRSPADIANAMTYMMQGFETGGLSGQNFNALYRSASGQAFLQYVAGGLDVSMGQLQSLAKEGELTAVKVAEAIAQSNAQINQDFAKLPVTFGENMTRMKDAALNWVDGLNQAGGPLDAINRKIEQFAVWLEGIGGQQFFGTLTQGVVYAGSVILPIVDNIAQQIMWLVNLAREPGNQAFFQSLGAYAQAAGTIINGLLSSVAALTGFIINNWPIIEPLVLGIVGALGLWKTATIAMNAVQGIQNALEIAAAGIKAAKTGVTLADASATAAATAAQWGLNTALLACPLTWIVVVIVAVIAIIVALIRWVMKLWETNDKVALGLVIAWNTVLNNFDTIKLGFARAWDAICTAFDVAKVAVLTSMELIINGVLSGVNFLINQLNRIPGVSIEAVGTVSWAANAALEAGLAHQTRASNIAAMAAENEAKALQREMDALAFYKNRVAQRVAENADKNQKAYTTYYEPHDYGNNGNSGINVNPDYGSDFNIGSVGRIKEAVDISSQDLKYLRDIAERESINQFTTRMVVPQLQITFGDIRETADVEQIKGRLTQMLEEELAVMAEGVHA